MILKLRLIKFYHNGKFITLWIINKYWWEIITEVVGKKNHIFCVGEGSSACVWSPVTCSETNGKKKGSGRVICPLPHPKRLYCLWILILPTVQCQTFKFLLRLVLIQLISSMVRFDLNCLRLNSNLSQTNHF